MRRLARSRRAVSRVLRRLDPDAKRRVTRLGRRPRPSRLNAGAARKRLRRRDDTSAAPKRGARDQGVARGARRTRRWAVRPAFLTFARPAGRAAAMPRAAPAARTTAHAQRSGAPRPAHAVLYEGFASLNRTCSPDGDGVARHRKA